MVDVYLYTLLNFVILIILLMFIFAIKTERCLYITDKRQSKTKIPNKYFCIQCNNIPAPSSISSLIHIHIHRHTSSYSLPLTNGFCTINLLIKRSSNITLLWTFYFLVRLSSRRPNSILLTQYYYFLCLNKVLYFLRFHRPHFISVFFTFPHSDLPM